MNPELTHERREAVARAIHETYRVNQEGRKPPDDPAMAAWDALPEHLRRSNRRQADHIFEKLRAIGRSVAEVEGRAVQLVSFTDDEIERMALMEHDRWWAERLDAGWTPGPRDVERKTTPHLVPWSELSEDVREWDREAVRAIPEVLAAVGLEIERGDAE